MAGPPEVRQVRPEEWDELRTIRLRALADTPSASARNVTEEEQLPPEEWRAAARTPIFVALLDQAWVGITGCSEETAGGPALIWGMWVAPEARRRGIGTRLLGAALGWARAQGCTRARLSVTETNAPAADLYRRAGFVPTGGSEPLPSDPSLQVIEMERPLG